MTSVRRSQICFDEPRETGASAPAISCPGVCKWLITGPEGVSKRSNMEILDTGSSSARVTLFPVRKGVDSDLARP